MEKKILSKHGEGEGVEGVEGGWRGAITVTELNFQVALVFHFREN